MVPGRRKLRLLGRALVGAAVSGRAQALASLPAAQFLLDAVIAAPAELAHGPGWSFDHHAGRMIELLERVERRRELGRSLSGSVLGLVELLLVFGAVVGFGVWQLRSLRRDERSATARHPERQQHADPAALNRSRSRLSCMVVTGRPSRRVSTTERA